MKKIRENYTLKDIANAFQKGMESQEEIDKKKVAELRKEICSVCGIRFDCKSKTCNFIKVIDEVCSQSLEGKE